MKRTAESIRKQVATRKARAAVNRKNPPASPPAAPVLTAMEAENVAYEQMALRRQLVLGLLGAPDRNGLIASLMASQVMAGTPGVKIVETVIEAADRLFDYVWSAKVS